jgi:hypothetical protein
MWIRVTQFVALLIDKLKLRVEHSRFSCGIILIGFNLDFELIQTPVSVILMISFFVRLFELIMYFFMQNQFLVL